VRSVGPRVYIGFRIAGLLNVPEPEVVQRSETFVPVAPVMLYEGVVMQTVSSGPAFNEAGKGSTTVTTELQVEILPLASVTVTVTVTVPRSAQVKAERLRIIDATEQLSVGGPERRSAATTEALPEALRFTVLLIHETTGSSVSLTVTVKEQVETMPSASVEV
jgi:hypothetical protein